MEWFELEQRKWQLVAPIASGRFGDVWEATDGGDERYAAKRVPKRDRARRELEMANLEGVRNVVPIIDKGEHGDHFVLVMPRAEMSLRERMSQADKPDVDEILQILTDVATALSDLSSKAVHRDLKPENVLLLDDVWCLADFGISRFADAATEPGLTHKESKTPAYAAPEQWRGEHAGPPTDVYALGVMAFELFEGRLPFGDSQDTLRDSHLGTLPPRMQVGSVLESLVHECLHKRPEVRPTAANLVVRLARAEERAAAHGWEVVAAANVAQQRRLAEAELAEAQEEAEYERRKELFEAAAAQWANLSGDFRDRFDELLPTAGIKPMLGGSWHAELNNALFALSYPQFVSEHTRQVPFDIIATVAVTAKYTSHQIADEKGWLGRSHGLYYADAFDKSNYRWFEMAFMYPDERRPAKPSVEPYGVQEMHDYGLHAALNDVQGLRQLAWPVTPLDSSDHDGFIQRWLTWFAQASMGQLERPDHLPEHPIVRNWR